jgi:hypothetical protein
MGFASGSLSFFSFQVAGEHPADAEVLLDKMAEQVIVPNELGVPEPVQWGWAGGRHVLDGNFSLGENMFAEHLLVAMRVDTNKIPGDLKKAYTAIESAAVAKDNPSGFISKSQKRDVKAAVESKLNEEAKTGKFRKTKIVPVLWDLERKRLYSPAASTTREQLVELMERTFGVALTYVGPGTRAEFLKEGKLEDLKPTAFVEGPAGKGQTADYPWVADSSDSHAWLGNEFLTWLWYTADQKTGIIPTSAGDVVVMFDKLLEMDCSFGENGKDVLHGAGPTQMPEAREALRSGKVPRKAGLILDHKSQQFTFQLQGDQFQVTGLQLPAAESADTPRSLMEDRTEKLRDFNTALYAVYQTFLKLRVSPEWAEAAKAISSWIESFRK